MTSRPLDTTPASWTDYEKALDRLGGPGRLLAAMELSDAVRAVRLDGIRVRHPELSRREAVQRLVYEEYGIDLGHPFALGPRTPSGSPSTERRIRGGSWRSGPSRIG